MAMEQHCPILQITGYKNSSKTTLMNKLIAKAAKNHWKTAAVKHHGHGGKPSTKATEKDVTII
ncbi:molybdopterin-guanine dinucleotide biosynthesis protein B [Alteribacillus persepolensis]|uniref:Molybdopterin-guanine dinucleotide biosynthesis protein B n=1 Tax=Alteribacillus persepolensis TaxID=568899 RepID=A0A1G8JKK3_9BACI|nr:molybdopterin-guanine dinucleotide biosynthesis protein MobB [Alteribacillus persepolensis]SDI31696.1 molybdopterin-guanine dinucleotide biosynthesis protein B [Alteribacillus persepolensis]